MWRHSLAEPKGRTVPDPFPRWSYLALEWVPRLVIMTSLPRFRIRFVNPVPRWIRMVQTVLPVTHLIIAFWQLFKSDTPINLDGLTKSRESVL